jgi:hypothetical protein
LKWVTTTASEALDRRTSPTTATLATSTTTSRARQAHPRGPRAAMPTRWTWLPTQGPRLRSLCRATRSPDGLVPVRRPRNAGRAGRRNGDQSTAPRTGRTNTAGDPDPTTMRAVGRLMGGGSATEDETAPETHADPLNASVDRETARNTARNGMRQRYILLFRTDLQQADSARFSLALGAMDFVAMRSRADA